MKELRCLLEDKMFAENSLRLDEDDHVDDGVAHGEDGPQDTDGSTVSQLICLVIKVA